MKEYFPKLNILEYQINALVTEYNALHAEKLIHKQSIRKIHVYVGSLITVALSLLSLTGLSIDLGTTDSSIALISNVILTSIPPSVLIVFAYGLNEFNHIYMLAYQISCIESKVNDLVGNTALNVMAWESMVCPVIFGKGEVLIQHTKEKKTYCFIKPSLAGDLITVIFLLPIIILATAKSYFWLDQTMPSFYFGFGTLYLILFSISIVIIIYYTYKVYKASARGIIRKVFFQLNDMPKEESKII